MPQQDKATTYAWYQVVIGVIGVAIAIACGIVALFQPDIRQRLGLEVAPTATPTRAKETVSPTSEAGKDWRAGCISTALWTPYTDRGGQQNVPTANPKSACWQLFEWGISAQDGGLLFFRQKPPISEFYSISTPILQNSAIELTMKANRLTNSEVQFRVNPNASSNVKEDNILSYTGLGQFRLIKVREGKASTVDVYGAEDKDTYNIKLEVVGIRLTVSIDDGSRNKVFDPISLDFADRDLWIAYFIDSEGSISVNISKLEIRTQ